MIFDQMMLHFGAPTICGIKPANLFSVKNENYSDATFCVWKDALEQNKICAFRAPQKNCSLVFLFNPDWVKKILASCQAQEYLSLKGYKNDLDCASFVQELSRRIAARDSFPHEVGLLLGYPISDIIAFERNKGKGFKFCGSWKAYSNVKSARECSCKYRDCSQICQKWFCQGWSLNKIIKEYKKGRKAA